MKIGLFGFDFVSPNKGCEAITYSFFNMICSLNLTSKIEIYNFTYNDSMGEIPKLYKCFCFKNLRLKFKSLSFWRYAVKTIKNCDVFFDATYGDGFSDIYGEKWNIKTNLIKQIVIWCKIPLVLVPQTYGPYKNRNLEKWAMKLIGKSLLVYSRDDLSAQIIKNTCGINIKIASDLAFKLPYDKSMYKLNSEKRKIGINISSLLWDSKWTKENHFELMVDYKEFHNTLISQLINDNNYEIHIIPHVINLERPNSRENDYRICLEFQKKYGNQIKIAPPFDTPIEAKSYISNMDIFIGSRMHSTIAAISSGVATIPFSYSRKFEGLFGNLEYQYVISAQQFNTIQALRKTEEWIKNYRKLKEAGKVSKNRALNKLDLFEKELCCLFKELV